MGLFRLLREWREKSDGTLTGPKLRAGGATDIDARLSSDLSMTSGSWTAVQFDNQVDDNIDEYDPSTGNINTEETGKYYIFAQVRISGSSSGDPITLRLRDRTNDTVVARGMEIETAGAGSYNLVLARKVELTSGIDYHIQAVNFGSSSTVSGNPERTFLTVGPAYQ